MKTVAPELKAKLDAGIADLYDQRKKHIRNLIRPAMAGDVIDCQCGHTVMLGEATLMTLPPDVDVTYGGGKIDAVMRERITVVCNDCAEKYGGSWPLVVDFMKSLEDRLASEKRDGAIKNSGLEVKGGDREQVVDVAEAVGIEEIRRIE